MRKNNRTRLVTGLLAVLIVLALSGCGTTPKDQANQEKPKLVLADAGWDSMQFNNSVAKYIIEKGYGYQTDIMNGSTAITFAGLVKGDIDIYMEVWTDNLGDTYKKAIDKGDIKELGVNFGDNAQGLYVPTYVIKGDSSRGIKALAPDLKTVQDLPKYWQLFKDPENPSKGRIYGSIPGWEVDKILAEKVKNYGLDKNYNYFSPGSDTALASSIAKAYEEGKPWLGYYWTPTWVMGKYDMTLLKDAPYSKDLWDNGYKCEFPSIPVTIAVNKNVLTKAPDVVDFLKNYKTSSPLLSEALAYMQKNKVGPDETAQWFLKNKEDLWTKWVPSDVATKIKDTLK